MPSRTFARMQWAAAAMAAASMILPPSLWAAEPLPPQAASPEATVDLVLHDGQLRGRVLNAQGVALTDQVVTVFQAGQAVTRARTDAHGRFAITGLDAGVYQLATAQGAAQVRLWTDGTEPPSARREIFLVHTPRAARGQIGPPVLGEHGGLFGLRWTTTLLLTATAIAVPVAVATGNDGGAPASP